MSAFFDEPIDEEEFATTVAGGDPRQLSRRAASDHEPAVGEPMTQSGGWDEQNPSSSGHVDEWSEDSDEEFIPKPPFRLAPLSIGLLASIVIGVGFIAGVLVQKHHDQGSTAAGRGATARAGGGAAGGFPGGAGGEGLGAAGGASSAASTGTGATSATPLVIGTLSSVSGQTLVVKNLGGKSVTVHVSTTTKVTTSFGVALKAGQTVSVTGTSAADGSVTAAAVTVSS